jgi:hypothetical protein
VESTRFQDRTVIYETVHGSRAYGLATSVSDTDRRGVFVPAPIAFLGYGDVPEQLEPAPERVLYDIRKFFRLAAACNPTLIEVLFTDPADHLVVTPVGARLLERRADFLSRRAGDSFGRYGLAQLRRIRTHRRWILDPPKGKPDRQAYDLPPRAAIPKDEQGAVEAMLGDGRLAESDLSPSFLALLDRERRYRGALREWQQYQDWLKSRNPARAELERRHGYDTKHAMHLIRLLRMAVEILSTGRVLVRRPDAEELRAIRNGTLSFDELLQQAEDLGGQLDRLAETSPLPASPNETRLNALCAELVGTVHRDSLP